MADDKAVYHTADTFPFQFLLECTNRPSYTISLGLGLEKVLFIIQA